MLNKEIIKYAEQKQIITTEEVVSSPATLRLRIQVLVKFSILMANLAIILTG